MKNIIATILMLLMVAGCGNTVVTTQPIQKLPDISVPTVQPIRLNDIEWEVYDSADLEKLAKKIKGGNVAVFVLMPDGMKKLEANMVEIKRYIGEQKQVNIYLKNVIAERSKTPEKK